MDKTNLLQPIIDQLKQEILDDIKPLFEDLKKSCEPKIPDENLTRKETCAILKINLSTLWSWTKKGKLVSYGCGNRVYYNKTGNTNKKN